MQASKLIASLLRGQTVHRARRALGAMIVVFAASAALAQSEDPPSRVGRLSEIQGPVYIAPDDPSADWQPIGLNYPISVGDNVWAGQDARAEIDFGSGHVRIAPETNIHFTQLDDRQFSAYLASGRAILRLRMLDPGETAKFDTANVQVDITRPGSYRIEADADGLGSTVIVREGEAQLRTVDGMTTVVSGQTATISGNGPGTAMVVREGIGTDGFDAWSGDRDRRFEGGSISTQYVSGYVPGVRDLDQYGTWETVPTYGAVWYPATVSTDWVPYRDGSWTFVRPWGWTWVDNAPWGWAPFHYGRWVHIGPRWAWCPGEYVRRPVYAPALVAWYGGPSGTNWSGGFVGGPTFGWVPLAWGEAYHPHHRHSSDYWRMVNRPYAVNVGRVPSKPLQVAYANARIPGAVTAVRGEVLTGKQPIGRNHIAVPVGALAGAAVTTTPLNVRPVTRPISADSRPRGAPAPASTFIGRGALDRPELRTPAASGAYTGRPRMGTEPVQTGRQTYTPSVGGSRTGIVEPAPSVGGGRTRIVEPAPSVGGGRPAIVEPATLGQGRQTFAPSVGGGRQMNVEPSTGGTMTRPGAGSPPPFVRQQELQPGRPTMREAAPITSAPAPLQVPGQRYQPSQRQAPVAAPPADVPMQGSGQMGVPLPGAAAMQSPPQRQMAPARASFPDQPAPMPQRPFVREAPPPAPQAQQYLPAPQFAPAPPQAPRHIPQQHAPAPVQPMQVAPAPVPAPAQGGRQPPPIQPAPGQQNQVAPPGQIPGPIQR